MDRTTIAKITTSGQISLPARVRKRWGTSQVVIEDEGVRLVMRPLPDAPIAAACGSLRRSSAEPKRIRPDERAAESLRQAHRASQ
jgi:bifunctional DNA-binding transcriptional regulator/antitoxin component of YhaV-PrlF toxin-antitoxin module